MDYKTAHKLSPVIKRKIVSKFDIHRIHHIASAKSEEDQTHEKEKLNADGHSVNFLQKDGLFEKREPKLLMHLIQTMKEADQEHWKLIENEIEDKQNVNYRVIEYHHYIKGGGLVNKKHFDGGSIMTAVIMLSDPENDFEGGRSLFWEKDDEFQIYDLKQGDMIVFPSHKFHSVSTVTKGERCVMVIELWEGPKGTDNHRTGGFSHLIPSFTNMF
eukprot:216555_1